MFILKEATCGIVVVKHEDQFEASFNSDGCDRFILAMTLQHLHGVHTHQDGTFEFQRIMFMIV